MHAFIRVLLTFAFTLSAWTQGAPIHVAEAADFSPPNPGLGVVVSWKPGTANEVSGLVFGTNAFTSIKDAVNTASANDTVFIAAGTYAEGSTILLGSFITLQGDGADVTTITGNYNHRVISTFSSSTDVIIDGISILDGSASGRGAGIDNLGELVVSNCIISGHEAMASNSEGAAVYNSGEMTIRNSSLSGNSASRGGAIANRETMTLIDVTVSGNSANLDGGGIFQNNTNATLTLRNSTISGNMANQNNSSTANGGGGIANLDGILNIENSTLSGNSVMRVDGGGIYNEGSANIIHATITGNTASTGSGGGISNFITNSLTMANTIVAGNTASNGPDTGGSFTGAGINFIGIPDTNFFATGFRDGTDLSFASTATVLSDLIDTTLAANGGPTLTHRLKPGSAAIDAGDTAATTAANITLDQRGTSRIANAVVDIGAVEIPLAPQFVSSLPAAGSAGLPHDSILTFTFDQPVRAGSGAILLRRSDDHTILPVSVSFSGSLVTITPDADLPLETDFYVEVAANAVLNIEGVAFPGISDPTALSFTTCYETVYVSQNLIPSNPQPGDVVTWIGETEVIQNLIVGKNAFVSVREAVDKVCADGTVILGANAFLEGSPVEIDKGLTLRGQGEGLTILSGNDSHRVVHVLAAEFGSPQNVVTMEALSVRNGRVTGDGAGILNQGADLTVRNSEFSDNLAVNGSGGGIGSSGYLDVSDSSFHRNSASGISQTGGGAISINSFGQSLKVSRCLFSENSAPGGRGAGGAILKKGSTTASVTECVFVMNTAMDAGLGAGIANLSSGLFTVETCTFSDNSVLGDGTAASSGGAIHSIGTMVVLNSTLSGNAASRGNGGAISNVSGNLTISNSTISGNTTSRISGVSSSAGFGSGIYTAAGSLSLVQCTVTGNSVSSNSAGRGIFNASVNGTPSVFTLVNSIVAGNPFGISDTRDIFGSFISQGVNFIGTLEDSIPSGPGTNLTLGGLQTVNDIIDTTLADNGGPTLTHLPVAGGPLINAGSNGDLPGSLTLDQRGFPRIDDGVVDIGAVEFLLPPALLSITPAVGSGLIDSAGQFVLTFNKDVFAGAGAIEIRRADTHAALPATVIISGNVVTLTTTSPLPDAVGVYIEIGENALLNATGDGFPAITDPGDLSFMVCPENVYVALAEDFIITGDQGAAGIPDDGDIVTWSSSNDTVSGLVFGLNAFVMVQRAVDTVCDAGFVHVAPGQYHGGAEIVISRSLTILGDRHERSELGRFFIAASHRILSINAGIDVTMESVTIRSALLTAGSGAGILNNGNLTIRSSTFVDNEAQGSGGAIANTPGAVLTAINSTFTYNTVNADHGGAIDNAGGTVELIHCTIVENSSPAGGGGIANHPGGTLTLTNSIVAGNTSAGSPDVQGLFTSVGANFIGEMAGSTPSGNGTNLTFASTGSSFESLLRWRSTKPTLTYLLVPGSPAIDAGSNADVPEGLTTDQFGSPRILQDIVDLGAMEFTPPMPARVLSITKENDSVTLVLSGTPAMEYRVEFAYGLGPASWFADGIVMFPGSGILTFIDHEAFAEQGFYRVFGPLDGNE